MTAQAIDMKLAGNFPSCLQLVQRSNPPPATRATKSVISLKPGMQLGDLAPGAGQVGHTLHRICEVVGLAGCEAA
jgi:hypothetical protein